jgi:hypothetical protein
MEITICDLLGLFGSDDNAKRKKKTVEDSRGGPPGGIEAGPLPGGRPNGGGGSCPGRPANLNRAVSLSSVRLFLVAL